MRSANLPGTGIFDKRAGLQLRRIVCVAVTLAGRQWRYTFARHDFSVSPGRFGEFDGAANLLPWARSQILDAYKERPRWRFQDNSLLSSEELLPQ